MSHLIDDALQARADADTAVRRYLRLKDNASTDSLVRILQTVHDSALRCAKAEEAAGQITELWQERGVWVGFDRAGHVHSLGAVGAPLRLGYRAEGCLLDVPDDLLNRAGATK